jgi:hypothetical protein
MNLRRRIFEAAAPMLTFGFVHAVLKTGAYGWCKVKNSIEIKTRMAAAKM